MLTYRKIDVADLPWEDRVHDRYRGRSAMGRSTVWITCPFCDTKVEAYIWSLAGSGKRCPGCGAIHHWLGNCTRKMKGDT